MSTGPALTLEHALLGFLRPQPMHAYEMYQRLLRERALRRVWHVKQSHLYALLARLERLGLISSATEPRGARPPRKVLSLTARGEEAFQRWLAEPVAHGRDLRLEFLAKLYFAAEDGPATVAQLVERQRSACASWLDSLQSQLATLDGAQTFLRLVLEFRISQLRAILGWLDRCEAELQARVSPEERDQPVADPTEP